MNGKQAVVSQSEHFTPSLTDKWLWWLATAEQELIKDCVADRNRYRIVGMSVLGTWLFATLAWTYFFSTATTSAWAYLPLGAFMGVIILTIDRTLIKGIGKANKNKLLPLLFRGLMAIAIGSFMAQPAILWLFDRDIKLQTSLDNEGRKMQKRKELDSLYAGQRSTITQKKEVIDNSLTAKYAEVEKARANFLAETDGTGGSGKLGISTIALAKKAEYEKLEADFAEEKKRLQPQADSLQARLGGIEDSIRQEEKRFAALLNNGFLTRIQALENLLQQNHALARRYWLVVAILVLVELMPVIAKTLLPSGAYDEKLRLQEELEKELAQHNKNRQKDLKEYYNEAALAASKQTVDQLFANRARQEKTDAFANEWGQDEDKSFDGLWQQVKQKVLPKWEQ